MCILVHGQCENPASCIFASFALIGYILITLFISISSSAVLCHTYHDIVAYKKCTKQHVCQKSQKSLFVALSSWRFNQILLYNNLRHNLVHVNNQIHNSSINDQKCDLECIQENTENVKVSYKSLHCNLEFKFCKKG